MIWKNGKCSPPRPRRLSGTATGETKQKETRGRPNQEQPRFSWRGVGGRMTKGDCKCKGAGGQRWGQADETIDGRMAGWMDGWLWLLWSLWSGGLAPWASAVGQQDHGRVTVDSLLLGCWCNKNDEREKSTRPATGKGSARQTHSARVIRWQVLIQEIVGSMLEKSQECPESHHRSRPAGVAGCGLCGVVL